MTVSLTKTTLCLIPIVAVAACSAEVSPAAAPAGGTLSAPPPQSVPVRIRMDGGYAFVFDEQKHLTVAALTGHPPHGDAPQMTLSLVVGEVSTDWPTRTDTRQWWDLTGYSMSIDGDAGSRAEVQLPPVGSGPLAPCTAEGLEGAPANDLRYLPIANDTVGEAASITLDRTLVESELAFSSGTLSIDRVGNCWTMSPAGVVPAIGAGEGRPMVLGDDSLVYTTTAPGMLTLTFRGIGGDKPSQTISVKPSNGRIVLQVDRDAMDQVQMVPTRLEVGEPDPHYQLFYPLVTKVAQGRLPVPYKTATFPGPVNPGDECVPFFLRIKNWLTGQ